METVPNAGLPKADPEVDVSLETVPNAGLPNTGLAKEAPVVFWFVGAVRCV